MKSGDSGHALQGGIPHLQLETAVNVPRTQRGGFRRLKFRDGRHRVRQAVKGDLRIQVMDMVKADVGGKPSHDRVQTEVARGFQRGGLVRPGGLIAKDHPGEVVLHVEQVGSSGARDETGQGLDQEQRLPAKAEEENSADARVRRHSDETIPVFAGMMEARSQAHAEEKDEDVAKQDRQGMALEQVPKSSAARRPVKRLGGHDREGSDVGPAELGIVVVMMVMGRTPDAARAERPDPKNAHEAVGPS